MSVRPPPETHVAGVALPVRGWVVCWHRTGTTFAAADCTVWGDVGAAFGWARTTAARRTRKHFVIVPALDWSRVDKFLGAPK